MQDHKFATRRVLLAAGFLSLVAMVAALSVIWTRRQPAATLPPTAPAPRPIASVVRLPGHDLVVVNVGVGDPVTPGKLFCIYDRVAGIPAAAAGGVPQPPKAMIEVVRIGPGFSECRVVRKAPNSAVAQGDLVVEPSVGDARLAVQPANSGQSPPLPPPAPAGVDTNPGRS